jgi:hypothetical protein
MVDSNTTSSAHDSTPSVAPVTTPVPATAEKVDAKAPKRFTWDAFKPEPDPLAVAKMTPLVTARRLRLTKYVKGALAGCAVLCAVAFVRAAGGPTSEDASASAGEPTTASPLHKAYFAKTLTSFAELKADLRGATRATSARRSNWHRR